MSPTKSQTAAAKLQAFARGGNQDGAGSSVTSGPRALPSAAVEGAAQTSDQEPTLRDVSSQLLSAITACKTSLTGMLEEVRIDISLLRQDLHNLRDRVRQVEDRVSTVEDTIQPMPEAIAELERRAALWKDKADDLENRMRRNNLRIVGLPERAEGPEPGSFVEKWLRELLPEAPFSSAFAVERAHRVPTRPLPPGAPPRPLLARLLNCGDRDLVLRLLRRLPELKYNGVPVSVFPDFSPDLQRRRASFQDVKRRLRDMAVPYSMIYPARLRVVDGDRPVFFQSPQEAEEWVSRHRRPPRR